MSRSLAIVLIWLIVLGGAAAAYKFFILDGGTFGGDQATNSTEPGSGKSADTFKTPVDTSRTGPNVAGTTPTRKDTSPALVFTPISAIPETRIAFSSVSPYE